MTEFLDACYDAIKVQETSIGETIKAVEVSEVSQIGDKKRIILVGAGDSYAVSEFGKWAFLAVGLETYALSPIDIMHVPLDSDSVVIGVTASGRSLSTLDALQKAKTKGASIIVLTDNPEGKAADKSSNHWVTQAGVNSYNVSPASPTTTAMAYLLTLAAQLDSTIKADLQNDLNQLTEIGTSMLNWAEKEGIAISKSFTLKPSIYLISDGPTYVAAEIGMMKFNEFGLIKGYAAQREEFCHHQALSINDNDQAILISGTKQADDEHYMHILTDTLKMQAYYLCGDEELGLRTSLAQTIPMTIALQMGAHHTVRRFRPDMEWFKLPHAEAFKIY